jgi:hypothetical protein
MTGRDLLPPVQCQLTGVGYSRSTPTAFSLKFMTFIKKNNSFRWKIKNNRERLQVFLFLEIDFGAMPKSAFSVFSAVNKISIG